MTRGATIALVVVALVVVGLVVVLAMSDSATRGASGDGWSSGSAVELSEDMIRFVDDLADQVGVELYVTSGIRSAADQARALMAKVDLGESIDDLMDLYQRDDLIAELADVPADLDTWTAIIEDQIARGELLSSHLSGLALDLRTTGGGEGAPGQLSEDEAEAVAAAALQLGAAKALVEETPPHLHIKLGGDYA